MARFILTNHALADAQAACRWYENKEAGLGERFFRELDECLDEIRERPGAQSPFERGSRKRRLRSFPHVVIFREFGDGIEVLAIHHPSRHPSRAMRRL